MTGGPDIVATRRPPLIRFTVFLLKAGVTFGLVWYALHDIPAGALWRRISDAQAIWFVPALALLGTMILAAAWRWWAVSPLAGAPLTFRQSLRFLMIGQFFNQTLPSSIGGDAFRVWLVRRQGASLTSALGSVGLDRLLGVVALAWLAAFGAIFHRLRPAEIAQGPATMPATDIMWPVLVLAVVAFAIVLVLATLGRQWGRRPHRTAWWQPVGNIGNGLFHLFRQPAHGAAIVIASLAIHAFVAATALAVFEALDVAVPTGYAVAAVSVAMLATALPISLGGWGVRETAMVAAFAPLGVAAADAVLVSVMLGLGMFLAGLPGGLLWISGGRRQSV